MGFKGTKGKFYPKYKSGFIVIIDEQGNNILDFGITKIEEANAKLIAAAPEMFDEIDETIIDLKILINQIIDANKTNHLFDGMPELIQKWIDRKEQLLTKITEE